MSVDHLSSGPPYGSYWPILCVIMFLNCILEAAQSSRVTLCMHASIHLFIHPSIQPSIFRSIFFTPGPYYRTLDRTHRQKYTRPSPSTHTISSIFQPLIQDEAFPKAKARVHIGWEASSLQATHIHTYLCLNMKCSVRNSSWSFPNRILYLSFFATLHHEHHDIVVLTSYVQNPIIISLVATVIYLRAIK